MNPFWNSGEKRLRALLRIGLQLLLFLLFALGLVFIMSDLLLPLIPENYFTSECDETWQSIESAYFTEA